MKRKTTAKKNGKTYSKRVYQRLKTPKVDLPFNLKHPDVAQQVEFAFECKGKKYYRMTNEFRLPAGRYKFLDAFLLEHELRMTPKMFNDYLDKLENIVNGRGGMIKISDIAVTIHNMRTHANLTFVPRTIKKLASVVYFDETEDLRDYDEQHAEKKIAAWEDEGTYSFFLTRPITELLNLEGISLTSLQTYMNFAETTINALISDLYRPSSGNSSETETSK